MCQRERKRASKREYVRERARESVCGTSLSFFVRSYVCGSSYVCVSFGSCVSFCMCWYDSGSSYMSVALRCCLGVIDNIC